MKKVFYLLICFYLFTNPVFALNKCPVCEGRIENLSFSEVKKSKELTAQFEINCDNDSKKRMSFLVVKSVKIVNNFFNPVGVDYLKEGMKVRLVHSLHVRFSYPGQADVYEISEVSNK
jgi:hypothetical protein